MTLSQEFHHIPATPQLITSHQGPPQTTVPALAKDKFELILRGREPMESMDPLRPMEPMRSIGPVGPIGPIWVMGPYELLCISFVSCMFVDAAFIQKVTNKSEALGH